MSDSIELTPDRADDGRHRTGDPAGLSEGLGTAAKAAKAASAASAASGESAAAMETRGPAVPTGTRTPAGPAYAVHYPADAMDEIDLLDLVKVVWRARWTIMGVALIAILAAFGLTVTKERVYESKGVFVIQTRPIPVGPDQGGGTTHSTAVLTSILRSRQLAETVVDSLSLVEAWGASSRSAAVKRLEDGISVNANDRDGIITISFKSADPKLARDIVANYVELFEERANELNVTEADRVLTFARERMEQVGAQLKSAETRLLQFKERYGIVSFQQQTQTLVSAHAALTDRIRTLSVELTGKRSYLTDRDPDVQALLARIAELERQARVLELGNGAGDKGSTATIGGAIDGTVDPVSGAPIDAAASGPASAGLTSAGLEQTLSFDFGLKDVPAIAMELDSLEREVQQQRQMYELLRQQHESARLDASRKANIVRLIDPPEVPTEPLPRGLVLNVALAGVVGAFAALMFAFVAEFLRQRAQDDATVRELPFLRFFRDRGPAA